MNLNYVKQLFQAEYEFECLKKGVKPMVIPESLIYFKISEGLMNLSEKTGYGVEEIELALQPGVAKYALSNVSGRVTTVEIDGKFLEASGLFDSFFPGDVCGEPRKYRILYQAADNRPNIEFFPLADKQYNCRLTIFPTYSILDYASEGLTNAGDMLFPFPETYLNAIKLYLLKFFFDEKSIEYERETERLRASALSSRSIGKNFHYNFGF